MANDVIILMGIITFFTLFGVIAPYINADMNAGLPSDQTIDVNEQPSVLDIGLSVIGTIFAWSFGSNTPVWLNIILWIPRFIMYAIVIRWIFGSAS